MSRRGSAFEVKNMSCIYVELDKENRWYNVPKKKKDDKTDKMRNRMILNLGGKSKCFFFFLWLNGVVIKDTGGSGGRICLIHRN